MKKALTKASSYFWSMRPAVRALVSLYWLYALAGSMVGVFTQVFLYQKFTSISTNIEATLIFYTGIMLGFCAPGVCAALLRRNIKKGFLWSFCVMGLSLISFLFITDVLHALFSMFFLGAGQGIFWLTVNTFELVETRDHERDYYSSVLNAGNEVISLVGPALATALILFSESVFHIGTYTLLFLAAPLVYSLGFFSFAYIQDYRPKPIRRADVVHFFVDARNKAAHLYTAGTGFQQMLGVVVPPLLVLSILGTPLHIGLYNTVFALFSALCILLVAQYRTQQNRLMLYGLGTAIVALTTICLGFMATFLVLIIYTIIKSLASPILGISSHVIDLSAMEIGREETDFYATMILRDFFLWIWRTIAGIVFYATIHFLGTDQVVLRTGMCFIAFGYVFSFVGAYFLLTIQARRKAIHTISV